MKIRNGFVSNSSSSSFIISLDNITGKQLRQIKHHTDCDCDAWNITVTDSDVKGFTIIDNFRFATYFDKIGVDPNIIEWGD